MTSARKAEANRQKCPQEHRAQDTGGKDRYPPQRRKARPPCGRDSSPGRRRSRLEEVGERLRTELQPVGELENMLVDRIISAHWRLRRLGRVEAGIFTYKYYGTLSDTREMEPMQEANTTTLGNAFVTDAIETNAFSKLSRYETTIERSLFKALHELQRLQAARGAGSTVSPPVAVDVDVSGTSREVL